MRPKLVHGTKSMTWAKSVLPMFIQYHSGRAPNRAETKWAIERSAWHHARLFCCFRKRPFGL
jgi:hypothetical protein